MTPYRNHRGHSSTLIRNTASRVAAVLPIRAYAISEGIAMAVVRFSYYGG